MKRLRAQRIVLAHPIHDRDAVTVGTARISGGPATFGREMIQRQKPLATARMSRAQR